MSVDIQRLTKTYGASRLKTLGEDGSIGRFEAVVAVFNNIDLQGDKILPGAFTKSLDSLRSVGDPVPCFWNHEWDNPNALIGSAKPEDITQTEKGLRVIASVDLTDPFAAKVYSLMKQRLIKEFSFAYDIAPGGDGFKGNVHELRQLELLEFGPTFKGANPETALTSIKNREPSLGLAFGRLASARSPFEMRNHHNEDEDTQFKHQTAPAAIQGAHDALVRAGAKCSAKSHPPPPDEAAAEDDLLTTLDTLLSERGLQ